MSTPLGSHPLTAQGTVMGTFQYMAPEQVEGKEADARSDIFALGAVLYEMATAKRAFEGKTAASAMAAVLEREPSPISTLQPMAPAALDHVVQGCLAKDPEARWQNAARHCARVALDCERWGGHCRNPVRPGCAAMAGAVGLGGTGRGRLCGIRVAHVREREPIRTLRSFLPAPPQMNFDFTGDFSGPPGVQCRRLGDCILCAHSERSGCDLGSNVDRPCAQETGRYRGGFLSVLVGRRQFIGFFSDGRMKKIPAAGGPVTILADAPNPRGGSWNQDNVIIYEPDYRDTLWKISAAGGMPVRLTKFENEQHTTHRWPQFLPDGKHFLFFATNHSGDSEHGIYFGSLADGSYKHVLDSDSGGQYASGHLLFHVQSQLQAQKFDPSTGTVSGDPMTVANFLEYDTGTWHTTFTASQNGLLAYEPGSKALGTDLYWMDSSGKTLEKVAERAFYKGSGRLSPDGKRLAVSMGDPQADIWVLDLARGSRTRLTFGGATHLEPSWSADGQRVVYTRQNGTSVVTGTSLRARLANGGGQEEVLMERDSSATPLTLLSPQLSPDGRYLVHTEQSGPVVTGVFALPLTGEKKPFAVVQPQSPQARIVQYRLSPDGRWLAYSSNESGREEVYVTHFPSGQGRWQVSQQGGTFPTWRGDSKEIWFFGVDSFLHAAALNAKSEEFELDPGRTLFQVSYTPPVGYPYDLSPDGKRLIVTTFPESVSTPMVLVTNWTAELKK